MRTGRPVSVTEHSYTVKCNGCWIWSGGVSSSGYGSKGHKGKSMLAHRFVYERFIGPIPTGMQLNHMCDVKLCVNPSHMVVGTQKDNVADMDSRGRRVRAHKITADQARRIKFGDEPSRILSTEIGLSRTCINYIRSGKAWAWL